MSRERLLRSVALLSALATAACPAADSVPPKRVLAGPAFRGYEAVRFSPDGRLVGVAHIKNYAHSIGVRLFRVAAHTDPESVWLPVEADERRAVVVSLAFSPDGKHVAAGCGSGDIYVWDLKTRERRKLAVARFYVFDLTFSPDGKNLYAAVHGGAIRFAFPSGGLVRTYVTCDDTADIERCGLRTYCVDVSPDGKAVAAAGGVWDAETGKERPFFRSPEGRGPYPFAARFSPDGTGLAVAGFPFGRDYGLLWHGRQDEQAAALQLKGPLRAAAFLPSGEELVVGGDEGLLARVRLKDMQVTGTYGGFEGDVRSVAVSPDGATLAGSGDGGVVLWDARPVGGKRPQGPAAVDRRP